MLIFIGYTKDILISYGRAENITCLCAILHAEFPYEYSVSATHHGGRNEMDVVSAES